MKTNREFSHTLLMLLACVLPLFVLFVLVLSGVAVNGMFFLLLLVLCCLAMFYFMGGAPMHEAAIEAADPTEEEIPNYMTLAYKAEDVFKPRTQYKVEDNLVIEGQLLTDPETAYEKLKPRFEGTDVTPLLQENEAGRPTLVLVPGALQRAHEKTGSPWLSLILFAATLVTTTVAGAMHQGVNLWTEPGKFAAGLPYALGEAVTEGHQVVLNPLAFAGWLGLLVTALNLLPIGQLDGGHIAHALFGRRNAHTIGMVALFSLFLLGLFVWSGLLFWAIIVFFVAGTRSAPPLNDVTPLDRRRVVIGALAFVLLFMILTPVPHAFYQTLGIHCPYI